MCATPAQANTAPNPEAAELHINQTWQMGVIGNYGGHVLAEDTWYRLTIVKAANCLRLYAHGHLYHTVDNAEIANQTRWHLNTKEWYVFASGAMDHLTGGRIAVGCSLHFLSRSTLCPFHLALVFAFFPS